MTVAGSGDISKPHTAKSAARFHACPADVSARLRCRLTGGREGPVGVSGRFS